MCPEMMQEHNRIFDRLTESNSGGHLAKNTSQAWLVDSKNVHRLQNEFQPKFPHGTQKTAAITSKYDMLEGCLQKRRIQIDQI